MHSGVIDTAVQPTLLKIFVFMREYDLAAHGTGVSLTLL
jgi:hypothetical protein